MRMPSITPMLFPAYPVGTRRRIVSGDRYATTLEDSEVMIRCSMTGLPMEYGDGIYDDGEWISWDWINGQIAKQDLQAEFPNVNHELAGILDDLIATAKNYFEKTGRYLQIWGELGELYAEAMHGLKLHKPHTKGSDGKIGSDFVEVKTISPERDGEQIRVKRDGNFNRLLVVKIGKDFTFQSQFIERRILPKGEGKWARASWSERGSD